PLPSPPACTRRVAASRWHGRIAARVYVARGVASGSKSVYAPFPQVSLRIPLPEVFMAGSQVAWGLDVGTTSLKAIKPARDGDNPKTEAFHVVEHDKFLPEPDIDRDEIIRHTLAKFLERNPVKRDIAFVGVPGSTTFARFVKLPPVEPRKVPEI